MDLVQGIYYMIHIGQVSIPVSLKNMPTLVDDMEIVLTIRKIFHQSFDTYFDKLCNPSLPTEKAKFKRGTLDTPKFRQLMRC